MNEGQSQIRRRENSCLKFGGIHLSEIAYDFLLSLFLIWCRDFIICKEGDLGMQTRIAIIGIIVENKNSVEKLNSILHEYSEYIIGRMGIPYPKHHISIISVAIDAPSDVISALSGKLGMLPDVNIKTVYSKMSIGE